MIELEGQESELKFTVQIERALTGEVEEYEITGKIQDNELSQESDDM